MPLSGKALDYLKDQLELHIRRFDASTFWRDTNFAAPTKVAETINICQRNIEIGTTTLILWSFPRKSFKVYVNALGGLGQ